MSGYVENSHCRPLLVAKHAITECYGIQARDYGMPFRNAAAQEFVAEIKKPLKTEQIKEWLRNGIP